VGGGRAGGIRAGHLVLEVVHVREGRGRGRGDVRLVVGERQGAGPRVEELRGGGAREHLRAQEAPGELGGPLHERPPGARVGVHERAGGEVVLRGSALGEVRREGERSTREADERGRGRSARRGEGRELGDRALDRLGDGGGGLVEARGVDRRELGDARGIPVGTPEDGPPARLDLDVDADELQRHDDVAEEDAGVDLVATHGLQRDLGGHRRVEARIEHAGADAQLAVLRQRAARLAHEPHRRGVAALAPVRAHETRVVGEAGLERMTRGEDHGSHCRPSRLGVAHSCSPACVESGSNARNRSSERASDPDSTR
jgi:hypothetical protein